MKILLSVFFMSVTLSSYGNTLEEVLKYATTHGPQFNQAEYMTKAQSASLRKVLAIYDTSIAFSASRDQTPVYATGKSIVSMGGSGSIGRNIGLGTTISASVSSSKTDSDVYRSSALLSANIDLLENLLGQMDRNSVSSSKLSIKKLNAQLEESRDALILGIVDVYLTALVSEKQLAEDRLILKNLVELERATSKKLKLGASEKRHLLQVKARRLSTQIHLEVLEDSLGSSLENLRAIVGGKLFKNLSWPVVSSGTSAEDSFTLRQLALEKSKLEFNLDSAKLRLLPTLKFSAGLGSEGSADSSSHFGSMTDKSSSLKLSLSFPLGNTDAKEEKNRARFSLLQNEMETSKARLNFDRDLQSYKTKTVSYQKQLSLSEEVRELQNERYKQEFMAYKQGRSQINDILSAHNDLINSRLSYIATKRKLVGSNFSWLNLNGQLSTTLGLGK